MILKNTSQKTQKNIKAYLEFLNTKERFTKEQKEFLDEDYEVIKYSLDSIETLEHLAKHYSIFTTKEVEKLLSLNNKKINDEVARYQRNLTLDQIERFKLNKSLVYFFKSHDKEGHYTLTQKEYLESIKTFIDWQYLIDTHIDLMSINYLEEKYNKYGDECLKEAAEKLKLEELNYDDSLILDEPATEGKEFSDLKRQAYDALILAHNKYLSKLLSRCASSTFTLSGSTVTQTGTDTSPAGAAGITGVTQIGTNQRPTYVFDGLKLIVDGTLTVPLYHSFSFVNTGTVEFTLNGNLIVEGGNGAFIREWEWIKTDRTSTAGAGQPYFRSFPAATLVLRGAIFSGEPTIWMDGTSVTINKMTVLSNESNMFRIYTGNMVFEGPLSNIGKRTTINTTVGVTLNDYSPANGTGMDHGTANSDWTVNNFYPEANTQDARLRFFATDVIYDSSVGMNTIVNPQDTGVNAQNGGCLHLFRRISFLIQDNNKNPIQAGKIFVKSYDDSNRSDISGVFSKTGINYNLTAETDTILTTGVDGTPGIIYNYLLKVWHVATTDGADFTTVRFSKNLNDAGLADFVFISYNHQAVPQEENLTGATVLDVVGSLLPDTALTIATGDNTADTAAVLAYTTQENVDRAYDHLKAIWVRDFDNTIPVFPVTKIGDTLDFSDLTVNIDGTGTGEASLSSITVTLNAANFAGNIQTTDTVNLLNSATITGGISDSAGTSLTVTHNAVGASFAYQNTSKYLILVGVYSSHTVAQTANPSPNAADYYRLSDNSEHAYFDGTEWVELSGVAIHEGFIAGTVLGGPGVGQNHVVRVADGDNIRVVIDIFGKKMEIGNVTINGLTNINVLLPENNNVNAASIPDALLILPQLELTAPDENGLTQMKTPNLPTDVDVAGAVVELARMTEGSLAGALATNNAELAEITNVGELTLKNQSLQIIPLDSASAGDQIKAPLKLNLVNYGAMNATPTTAANTFVCFDSVSKTIVNGATLINSPSSNIPQLETG